MTETPLERHEASRSRRLASATIPGALAVIALVVAGCVAAGSPSPVSSEAAGAGASSAASAASAATSETSASSSAASSGAGNQMPAPSAPSSATLESPQPSASGPASGSGSGTNGGTNGGAKGNYLIVCLGPGGGGPCVPAAVGGYVIAAEDALPAATRATVTNAAFEPSSCAAAGVTCAAGDAGAGTVTLTLSGGKQERIFVVKHANGSLGGVVLP